MMEYVIDDLARRGALVVKITLTVFALSFLIFSGASFVMGSVWKEHTMLQKEHTQSITTFKDTCKESGGTLFTTQESQLICVKASDMVIEEYNLGGNN